MKTKTVFAVLFLLSGLMACEEGEDKLENPASESTKSTEKAAKEAPPVSLTLFEDQSKFGFKDPEGKVIIPAQFDLARSFHENRAAVGMGGENETGHFDGLFGFIDPTGKLVVDYKYTMVNHFSHGRAAVSQGNEDKHLWGFIDPEGNEVIPFQYDLVDEFRDGLCTVWKGATMGFIDLDGNVAIPFDYEDCRTIMGTGANGDPEPIYFSEKGLVMVAKDGLWGFIDRSGAVKVPLIYDDVNGFTEELCGVQKDGLWGFIDPQGEVVIDFKYELANDFENGHALVYLNGSGITINKKGNCISNCPP